MSQDPGANHLLLGQGSRFVACGCTDFPVGEDCSLEVFQLDAVCPCCCVFCPTCLDPIPLNYGKMLKSHEGP